MLGDCSGFSLDVKELTDDTVDVIPEYASNARWIRLRLKSFPTAHEEIGHHNSTRGLRFSVEVGGGREQLQEVSQFVVLGDTEYERAEHRDPLMAILCSPSVKTVVLHIGASQIKRATGKHLYLTGLRNILSDMDSELNTARHHGRVLVLVSEWGLEHATRRQISRVCGPLCGFNEYSPILETMRCLQRGLEKIHLIPADIGLTVGMESGKVYLDEQLAVVPEDVCCEAGDEGLRYKSKEQT